MPQRPEAPLSVPTSELRDYHRGHLEIERESGYVVAVNMAVASVPMEFTHPGSTSTKTDETVAFDTAETGVQMDGPYMGQVSLIQATSFGAEPTNGYLLGLDILQPTQGISQPHPLVPERAVVYDGESVSVYSIEPLYEVTKMVFGTRERPRYLLYGGSHVIAAYQSITEAGPVHLYTALAVAIPTNRAEWEVSTPPFLIMEDVGRLIYTNPDGEREAKEGTLRNLARSCIRNGRNYTTTQFETIYVGMRDILVPEGEMGCALVVLPYLRMAQNFSPDGGVKQLRQMSIEDWISWQERSVGP